MGLWILIFKQHEWDMYERCSERPLDDWNNDGSSQLYVGVLYATLGIIGEILYIPFVIVMLKKQFIEHSCYKFMLLICIIDMIGLPFNAIITGIQCAKGLHFCTNPKFYFIVGSISTAMWYGCSMTCIWLAFNRFFEMCYPKIAEILFKGKRIYIWLLLPIIYILYSFNLKPLLYNNVHHALFFDPYVGSGFESDQFLNTHHTVYDCSVFVIITGLYVTLCINLAMKYACRGVSSYSKFQLHLTLQSLCICVEMNLAILIYVYMQYFPISDTLIMASHVCWILVHADTPIVYFIFNGSMRAEIYQMVKNIIKRFQQNSNTINVSTTI